MKTPIRLLPCIVSECQKMRHAGDYCTKHYTAWKRWGNPDTNHKRLPGTCSLPDCDKVHVANGYCRMHWKRDRYGSLPLESPPRYSLRPTTDRERAEHRTARFTARRRAQGGRVILPKDVLDTYGTACFACDEEIDLTAPRTARLGGNWRRGLHLDHVTPLSKGGEHTIENIRPTHAICNLSKSTKAGYGT